MCETAALNFPSRKGTATGLPLAMFGLSAFFFSFTSSVAFPDNTADLLLLLASLTFALPFFGNFFTRTPSQSYGYKPLPKIASVSSIRLSSRKSEKGGDGPNSHPDGLGTRSGVPNDDSAEVSSLLSTSSDDLGDVQLADEEKKHAEEDSDSHQPDIRGLAMLRHGNFYQLWCFLGLMTGVGLMTIK